MRDKHKQKKITRILRKRANAKTAEREFFTSPTHLIQPFPSAPTFPESVMTWEEVMTFFQQPHVTAEEEEYYSNLNYEEVPYLLRIITFGCRCGCSDHHFAFHLALKEIEHLHLLRSLREELTSIVFKKFHS